MHSDFCLSLGNSVEGPDVTITLAKFVYVCVHVRACVRGRSRSEHVSQAKHSSKTDIAKPWSSGCILRAFLPVAQLRLYGVQHVRPLSCPLHKGELLRTTTKLFTLAFSVINGCYFNVLHQTAVLFSCNVNQVEFPIVWYYIIFSCSSFIISTCCLQADEIYVTN